MGQAKKRGTFEERVAQAKVREEEEWKKRTEEWNKRNPPRVDARPNVADLMNAMLAAASSTSRDVKFIRGLMSGR